MTTHEPAPDMIDAARAFLASLSPASRSKASLPFNSPERLKWAYVPMARAGLPWKEMTPREREAALALLRAGLSEKGFMKVDTIRKLEDVLRSIEGWSIRDPDLYYFSVFGEPSAKGAWGWRYEGHHVSLHWTLLDGRVAGSAPQFLGANPAEVRDGALRGTRALAVEEDLGRALVKSLNQGQRAEAILTDTPPSDILSSGARAAAIQEDRGIAWARLDHTQQGILLSLIREYAATQTPAVARERLDEVRRGLSDLRFAWLGGLEPGQGHYYRIQGRAFLIEYDNTQNHANHIHSVWREFHGDWGEDVLAEHYRSSAHHADYRRAFRDEVEAAPLLLGAVWAPALTRRAVMLAIVVPLAVGAARAAGKTPEVASVAAQAALRSCLDLDGASGVEACRQALTIPSPPARRALLVELLARKLGDLRQWAEAATAYADLVSLRPQDAEARVALGEVLLYGVGRAADAVPVLREALLRDPDNAEACAHLGVALNSLGRYDEAVSSFEEALKRDPAFLDSRPAAKEAFDASRRSEAWP